MAYTGATGSSSKPRSARRGTWGAPAAVLTFEPHPRDLFSPGEAPYRITPFRSKAARLQDLGVDVMVAIPFTRAFSQQTAEVFVRRILIESLQVRHVVTGYDFVFGHKRGGDARFLAAMADRHGFALTVVEPVVVEGTGDVFGSSHVRRHLRGGEPVGAAEHLGRWWEILGRVRPGAARGHDLGYPTANLDLGNVLRPRFGIYAVRIRLEGEEVWRPAWPTWASAPCSRVPRPCWRSICSISTGPCMAVTCAWPWWNTCGRRPRSNRTKP